MEEIETRPPVALALDQLELTCGESRIAASPGLRDLKVEIRGAIPHIVRYLDHTGGAHEGGEATHQTGNRLGGFISLDVGHHGAVRHIQSRDWLDEEPRELSRGWQWASRRRPLQLGRRLVLGLAT